MGEVWQVTHLPTGSRRALKCILPFSDVEAYARFEREAQALGRLSHPHVVRVHEAGRSRGRAYLVMDLAQRDLLARLESGLLPPTEARWIALALAEGLAEVHAQGLLHRDLKPQNVLFADDGRPLLADFGLAKVSGLERLTRTGELLGTPAYMAPEQVVGAPVDERTDVYGLGAVLYHLLTGQAPVEGTSPMVVMQQVVEGAPTPPSKLRADVPRDLERICLCALAKDPQQRFPSARAFADALRAEGQVPALARGGRPWLGLSALGLAAAAGLVALAFVPDAPSVPARPQAPRAEATPPPLAVDPPPAAPSRAPAAPPRQPLDVQQAVARALELRRRGKYAETLALMEQAYRDASSPEDRVAACMGLIQALAERPVAADELELHQGYLRRAEEVYRVLEPLVATQQQDASLVKGVELTEGINGSRKLIDLQRSRVLSLQGDHDQALAVAQRIWEQHPYSLAALSQLARCEVASGDPEAALERMWRFSASQDRPIPDLLQIRYEVLGDLVRHEEQEEVAEELTTCSSNWWFFQHVLRARERGQDYTEALAEYEGLKAAPEPLSLTDAERRVRLAFLLELFGEAHAYAENALERTPGSFLTLLTLAEIRQLGSRHADSLDYAERALQVRPDSAQAEAVRAVALWRMQRHEACLASVTRALELDPELADRSLLLWAKFDAEVGLDYPLAPHKTITRMRESPEPFFGVVAKALEAHLKAVRATR